MSTRQQGDFALGTNKNWDQTLSKDDDSPLSAEVLFAGGGELGALMRQFDWGQTALGPVESWPQSLRTCVRIILTSRQPMFVWWGDELINLYNDAYKSILGGKHPNALGTPAPTVWAEIWDQVGPRAESALRSNEGTYDESLLLIMERHGYREETYYTFSYSPVPNDEGGIGGILCANTDGTARIVSERRVALLRELVSRTANARTWREACKLGALGLGSNPQDICFALIYTLSDSRNVLELAGNLRVEEGHSAAPPTMELDQNAPWPVETAMRTHDIQLVNDVDRRFTDLPGGAWQEAPRTVAVVPLIASGGTGKSGVIIAGLNPYGLPDDNYLGFLKLVAGQISASIVNAEAFEQERRRAEALAELDRAKTIFFSNVSHEFRTPLTLMLGPLEDLLADPEIKGRPEDAKQISIVHRNGLRLLRLVNTLLDFSRIESRRIQAVYRPVNLAERTADLASVFRSTIERAGLKYSIECHPLREPAYVDVEMWEKIVLNLLSNAFKFTLKGEVNLTLRNVDGHAELCVRDTGTGIPESEIPHIFERFHRIDGAPGRTHEGTGIGLALVDELVRLHGGTVLVESKLGEGTAFTVKIPLGTAHLPTDRISVEGQASPKTIGAAPFVQEAMRWLPDEADAELSTAEGGEKQDLQFQPGTRNEQSGRPRVVLADDNRDMREYVQRLLERRYDVTALSDGEQALAEALEDPPDLVLTDVMMPNLDGFQLLHQLRQHPETATLPVIMLSARAGEEAQSEGMEAGADDYLVKPFTARELMARVGAHISMYRLRCELTERQRELRTRAEQAERHYRTIVESIIEGFVFIDRNWRIRYANDRWAGFAGLPISELTGRDLWELFPGLYESEFGQCYREVMRTGQTQQLERYYGPLDRWFHVSIFPSPEGILIFSLDETEKHLQHERLMLTEKLAATGRLAATIAHEINNPLESVLNLIYLARTAQAHAEIEQYLSTAEKEITRVSHIARHTLGFYRDTSLPAQIDPEALIREVLVVYESRLRAAGIEVQIHCTAKSVVQGLRGEMHQVLSNLISNSIDAMPQPGRISIAIEDSNLGSAQGIGITFSDTGKGIPAENLPRLFEPFFTTKPNAGTGLGLWVVKQFIDSWGGRIKVESSTGSNNHGTTFTLFVPLIALSKSRIANIETAQNPSENAQVR